MFNLLRGHHHLLQMRRGSRSNEVPPSFRGIRNFLAQLAPPALPTNSTATLLRGNAANWLQMNLQILEKHYEDMIAGIKTNLPRPVEIDHQWAWQVALAWAVKKYKINEEVMRRVGEDLRGVGLRINQIPMGTTLRALMDAPTGRPHPRTRHKPREAGTAGSSLPSTSAHRNPGDMPSTTTSNNQPSNTTHQELDLPPTHNPPSPPPTTTTHQDYSLVTPLPTERPLLTTIPVPITNIEPRSPPLATDSEEDPQGEQTDLPPSTIPTNQDQPPTDDLPPPTFTTTTLQDVPETPRHHLPPLPLRPPSPRPVRRPTRKLLPR